MLYGIDVFVHPEYRGMRLARRLYEARKELCERLNLKAIVAGGRIPNYSKFAEKLTPREYIERCAWKEICDPTLTFQLSNDFHVLKVMKGYLAGDTSSLEYATLIEWNNIYHDGRPKIAGRANDVVRLGLVQWQMRPFRQPGRLVRPGRVLHRRRGQLQDGLLPVPRAVQRPAAGRVQPPGRGAGHAFLANYTEPLETGSWTSRSRYNVNIITGSMPMLDSKHLKNVGFLCRRDGTWERFEKVHITPNEVQYWGMVGGDEVRVFDTDCGKVGVLMLRRGFPELPRLMALQECRSCSYPSSPTPRTATSGCGAAPGPRHRERVLRGHCGRCGQPAQGGEHGHPVRPERRVHPSDFAFPTNGVKSEATPTEMTLMADVDRDLLKELNAHGAVRNLKDRRTDLYTLGLKGSAIQANRTSSKAGPANAGAMVVSEGARGRDPG